MPELGEIRRAKEFGYTGYGKYIWQACEGCGKERWVHLVKGIPISHYCINCGQAGEKSWLWKGGRKKTHAGYIVVKLHSDDFFYPMVNGRDYIMEHRLVMAKHLGRCLQSWEIVHHLNGIRDDNRLENLACTMKQYHRTHTTENILKEYIYLLEGKIIELEAKVARLQKFCQQ